MKIALIGLDSTHTTFFSDYIFKKITNKKEQIEVFFYDDNPSILKTRLTEYTATKIDELSNIASYNFDIIMILSRFGNEHFKLAKECIGASPFLFIDKPLTTDFNEALQIKKFAEKTKTKIRSHTPLIFSNQFLEFSNKIDNKDNLKKIIVEAPLFCRDLHGDERFMSPFFYGIHAAEMLFHLIRGNDYNYSITNNKKNIMVSGKIKDVLYELKLIDKKDEFYNLIFETKQNKSFFSEILLDGSYYEFEINSIFNKNNWEKNIGDDFQYALKSVELLSKVESLLQ